MTFYDIDDEDSETQLLGDGYALDGFQGVSRFTPSTWSNEIRDETYLPTRESMNFKLNDNWAYVQLSNSSRFKHEPCRYQYNDYVTRVIGSIKSDIKISDPFMECSYIDSHIFIYNTKEAAVNAAKLIAQYNSSFAAHYSVNEYYKESEVSERYFSLFRAYQKEFDQYHTYLRVSEHELLKQFNDVAEKLAQLKFIKAVVEFLKDDGFKFTLLFDDDKMVMVSKPIFGVEDLNESQIVFSYFVSRKFVASHAVELQEFVEKFKEFLEVPVHE